MYTTISRTSFYINYCNIFTKYWTVEKNQTNQQLAYFNIIYIYEVFINEKFKIKFISSLVNVLQKKKKTVYTYIYIKKTKKFVYKLLFETYKFLLQILWIKFQMGSPRKVHVPG